MFKKIQRVLPCVTAEQPLPYKPTALLDIAAPNPDFDPSVIYQNRRNCGVNFGSLFVLEKWIFESLFNDDSKTELEAVTLLNSKNGTKGAAEKLKKHYEDYLDRVEWDWLVETGVTSIRLPIGYWHVNNGAFVRGTLFEKVKNVYQQAMPWDFVKALIEEASKHKIGVLLDIHGLPGGANGEAHGGEGKDPTFFSTSKFVDLVCDEIIPFMVMDTARFSNVVGIQCVNEAAFNYEAVNEKKYYQRALRAIREHSQYLPLVISDGWWPDQWSYWLRANNLAAEIVIDSHVYRTFQDSDREKSAEEIIDDLKASIKLDPTTGDFMVGEFSCVLDEQTWSKSKGNRQELAKQFGQKQVSIFNKVATCGWYFWTYMFQHGDGGDWGFVPSVTSGAIPRRQRNAVKVDDKVIQGFIDEHNKYWDGKGGDKMEHWRFADALKGTVKDIQAFDRLDNSRIGRLHFWRQMRREQYIRAKGDSDYMWEWDQGFEKALAEFNK
ncbi:HEL295Wp [Eremothecium sinecaudum]|uniref:HEL295Wp n=1 Tax=Eremothecium sinecaudum TaxID=45286 RepID=A0A109UX95_9SACH|nr:HEL295Wp [Eremothecium sinecaudum]AMD20986.1 HEL295Wp [Eremothecium sinecaudum]